MSRNTAGVIFGALRNPDYLKKVQAAYQARKKYEWRSEEYRRRYFEDFQNNYRCSDGAGSTRGFEAGRSLEEPEREIYKQFCRTLSKKYHPDRDTSKEMQILNQLKQQWGV